MPIKIKPAIQEVSVNPIEELSLLVRAREPIIYIVSQEEQRVLDAIKVIASIPAKLDKDTRLGRLTGNWLGNLPHKLGFQIADCRLQIEKKEFQSAICNLKSAI